MNQKISRLALIVNEAKDKEFTHTRAVLAALKTLPLTVFLSQRIRDAVGTVPPNVVLCDEKDLYKNAECALVLGGDGSVIKAASEASPNGISVLGINLGRVGYLSALESDALSALSRLCAGEYRVEDRMMLDVRVLRADTRVYEIGHALNDAVISNGAISHMVELDVCCDGQMYRNYHADGVIVSTPTGSTAYSMAAGGPIVDPMLACICMTPVCSYSLTARPIIFSPDSQLSIKNVCEREDHTYLTVDGLEHYKLSFGDTVLIQRSNIVTRLIRFDDDGFVSQLNKKF